MEGSSDSVAVIMVPFPEQSHLNSLLQLSHILASFNIHVHYVASTTLIRQVTHRSHSTSSSYIHFHGFNLPPIPEPDSKPDSTTTTQSPIHLLPVFLSSVHLRLPFCDLLQSLSPKYKRVVVIHDCNMASVVQDVKAIVPNSESYSFFAISAFSLFCIFWDGIPLDEKPFQLHLNDIDPTRIPSDDGFIPPEVIEFVLQQFEFLGLETGRLYNTSRALEGRFVQLLEKLTLTPTGNSSCNSETKHFAIGPFNLVDFNSSSEPEKQRHECVEWLDKQESHSVLYICFGSTTSMSDEQNAELAQGLERSGVKFIWVIRKADTADIFADDGVKKAGSLPEGWEERMRDKGMVIREWAPQVEILSHKSIGGFMSHCGWNSCIESISMGVPIAAWPMHSDQPKNAFLVSEVLRVGILVSDGKSAVVSSGIEDVITRMMVSKEGDEMRKRAVEMGEIVRGSVAKGGASSLELESFVAHITR